MNSISESFKQDGYYVARGLFKSDEITKLRAAFDEITEQLGRNREDSDARWQGKAIEQIEQGNRTSILHTHNVQQYSAAWSRALLHEGLMDVSRAILGQDIVLHHTKLFQKPAEKGSPFPMHQDWPYFPTVKDSMIAAVVHLSEATDEMGCFRIYPGSHQLGRIAGSDGQTDSDVLKDYPIEKATAVACEPGDVIFFHYFTLHGSMPNRSSKIRKTVLIQMHAGDDEMEPGVEHAYDGMVLSGFNRHMTRNRANAVNKA